MTPREGVSVDDPAEREAFAAHMRKRHAYEYVYWNGAGQPSAKRPDTPYGEGWVPCDEQWAAWLGRASLAHPAATAREEAWKALLAYAECEQSFEAPTTEAMCATLARHGWVEGTPPIRFVMDLRAKALALARSTGGS